MIAACIWLAVLWPIFTQAAKGWIDAKAELRGDYPPN